MLALLVVLCAAGARGQGRTYFAADGSYQPPPAGTLEDHRTYVYKDRRYGSVRPPGDREYEAPGRPPQYPGARYPGGVPQVPPYGQPYPHRDPFDPHFNPLDPLNRDRNNYRYEEVREEGSFGKCSTSHAKGRANVLAEHQDSAGSSDEVYRIGSGDLRDREKIIMPLKLNGTATTMELGTGAAVSTMAFKDLHSSCPNSKMSKMSITRLLLKTYTEEVQTNLQELLKFEDRFQLPGILGSWRPDLQGRQRPDSPRQETGRDVSVRTPYGEVQGFRVYLYEEPDPERGWRTRDWNGVDRVQGNVSVFLGIPYALPPVGQARFKPPRPHPGWQVMQAVDFGPACPQPNRYTGFLKGVRDVHEDCLYLNVYTPSTGSGLAQLYPVLVHIHGGDFLHGASNLFQGHMLAGFYGVVVVTFNYRLGALGFLSTADQNSPGNYGILDMAMALRWVHENIRSFNGDPESVTLFGTGAGAAAAGLLMVNPRTQYIIKRVIAQSGSALADWALIQDKYRAQNTSRVFAQSLGCSIDSSYLLVECLRSHRSSNELGNAEFQPQVGMFPWGPVLDGNFTRPGDAWYEGWKHGDWFFTNSTPEEDIKQRKFNHGLVYMTGVTSQEAAPLIYNNDSLAANHYEIDEQWFDMKIKEMVFRYNYTLNQDGIYRAIKYRYTYWPEPLNPLRIREQYIDMMSDFIYRAPTDHIVKLLTERQVPVYMYVMNTTIEALALPEWRKYPHDIEHLLLTGAPFMDHEFFPEKLKLDKVAWTNNDRNMSHFFMKAFSNFARYGNPTYTQILGIHFELARQGELRYLNLNTTYNSSIFLNYRQTESAFWTWYLPTVIGILVPTYPPFTEYWWEPKEPLQIAFWSMSGMNLLLIVVVVIFCILWRNAKRNGDPLYGTDLLVLTDDHGGLDGIENRSQGLEMNPYEYRDKKPESKTASTHSLRSSQTSILDGKISKSPNGRPRTPPVKRVSSRSTIDSSVPMTQV